VLTGNGTGKGVDVGYGVAEESIPNASNVAWEYGPI
jgi:hypothetical protein